MDFPFKIRINHGKQRFIGLYTIAYRVGDKYKYFSHSTLDLKRIIKKFLTLFKTIYLVNFFRFRKLTRLEFDCEQKIGSILDNFMRQKEEKDIILFKEELIKIDTFSNIPPYFGEYYLFDEPMKIDKTFFTSPLPYYKKRLDSDIIINF